MCPIGEQIKSLRNARKLTQAELAARIGVKKSAVSAYENDTRMPSYEVLVRIARLFHTSVDQILGRGSGAVLDVSGLTGKQVSVVQDIVETYQKYNRLCAQFSVEPGDLSDGFEQTGLKKR